MSNIKILTPDDSPCAGCEFEPGRRLTAVEVAVAEIRRKLENGLSNVPKQIERQAAAISRLEGALDGYVRTQADRFDRFEERIDELMSRRVLGTRETDPPGMTIRGPLAGLSGDQRFKLYKLLLIIALSFLLVTGLLIGGRQLSESMIEIGSQAIGRDGGGEMPPGK